MIGVSWCADGGRPAPGEENFVLWKGDGAPSVGKGAQKFLVRVENLVLFYKTAEGYSTDPLEI